MGRALVLAAALFTAAPLRAEEALTLAQLSELVEAVNPALKAAEQQARAADATASQAALYPNPTLTYDYAVEKTVGLSQDFELPGKRHSRLETGHREADLSRAKYAQVRADLKADVEEAYYQLLLARQRADLLKRQAQTLSKMQAQVGQRYQPGLKNSVDTVRIDLEAAGVQKASRQAAAEEEIAIAALNTLLLRPATASLEIQGSLETSFPQLTLERLQDAAGQSPALVSAQKAMDLKSAELSFARKAWLPDIKAGPNYSRGSGDERLIGFNVGVPLPLWNRNQRAVAASQSSRDAAQFEASGVQAIVAQDLHRQLRAYQAAQEQVRTFQAGLLDQAAQVMVQAQSAYKQGLINLTDFLDVLRTSLQAKDDYAQALWESHRSLAEIERRLGRPLE
ncbi:MAG: TolC family protein [Elusimicrobia bacterium]|nr:TolC family protein [Elusimicrobiota bacterium]MDE2424435.1 TolC family protein [Elusimicrobiota bacterium]